MHIRNIFRPAGLLAAFATAAQLAGCGGGGGTAIAEGTLRVAIANTGSATCAYDTVHIAIDSVMVNPNANAAPGDAGWQPADVPLALRQAKKIDLHPQSNEAPQEIVTMTVPAARYAQVRLWLEQTSVLVVTPNWVSKNAGTDKIALDTSKAASIPVQYAFTVPANGRVDLTLNVDACRSIVDAGGTLQLIPVISATSASGT